MKNLILFAVLLTSLFAFQTTSFADCGVCGVGEESSECPIGCECPKCTGEATLEGDHEHAHSHEHAEEAQDEDMAYAEETHDQAEELVG